MKTHTRHLLTLAVLLGFTAQTWAQTSAVPDQISYQGVVTDAGGTPVGNVTPENRTVVFRIWDHATNTAVGNLIYSEQQVVTISKGEFSVLVGDGTAVTGTPLGYSETAKGKPTVTIPTAFGGTTRFIGVSVYDNGGAVAPEISPRQRVVSSAFAYRAKFAESLGANGGTAITTLNDGKVGVGTATPASLFTITGANTSTTTNTPQMMITDSGDPNERLLFGLDSTGNGTSFIQSTKVGTGAQNLALNPNGGNVGIGTASPRSILDIAPATATTDGIRVGKWADTASRYIGITDQAAGFTFPTTGGFSGLEFGGPASAAEGFLAFHTHDSGASSAERMRIDKSGNVGIGMPPAAPLDISRPSGGHTLNLNNTSGENGIAGTALMRNGTLMGQLAYMGTTNGFGYAGGGDLLIGGYNGADLRFDASTSGTEAMRMIIKADTGNVGIGTSTPNSRLTIGTPINGQGFLSGINIGSSTGDSVFAAGQDDTHSLVMKWVRNATVNNAYAVVETYGGSNPLVLQNSGGNVGIGTTSPQRNLQIGSFTGGDKYIRLASQGGNIARSGLELFHFNSSTGFSIVSDERSAGPQGLHFINHGGASGTRMFIDYYNGRVGVGTTAPQCPLDVRGGTDVVLNGNYTSIKSEWYVQAFGYGTMSDQRIKQIVDRSNSASDLETVMKLQVTDYQMKAQVMKGNPVHKGLIAQEVEKVIPEAVLKSEAYVPEIFELAKQAEYDSESKSLKVTMGKPHQLAVGDMVMITSKDAETDESHYLKVTQVTDAKAFVVGDVAAEIKKVFVFGKQVKDFRSVDYNRVYTTGIGAIQHLKKEKDAEVKALKEENEALKARVIALEAQTQRLADLEAKDKAREARLAAIEKLLLAADKAAAKPVSLKKSAGGAE